MMLPRKMWKREREQRKGRFQANHWPQDLLSPYSPVLGHGQVERAMWHCKACWQDCHRPDLPMCAAKAAGGKDSRYLEHPKLVPGLLPGA